MAFTALDLGVVIFNSVYDIDPRWRHRNQSWPYPCRRRTREAAGLDTWVASYDFVRRCFRNHFKLLGALAGSYSWRDQPLRQRDWSFQDS